MHSDFELYLDQTRRKLELLQLQERLDTEIRDLKDRVHQLGILAHNEQADVENLETPGLKNFFLNLTGKKQERLEQELAEARRARQQLDAAQAKLNTAEYQLTRCSQEYALLGNCEEQLARLLNLPASEELSFLEQLLSHIDQAEQDISQLLKLLNTLSQLGSIRTANLGTPGLGGTDTQLRSAENTAQAALEQLKKTLLHIQSAAASCQITLDTCGLEQISSHYLTDLYTTALIDIRTNHVTLTLRQIRVQLQTALPKLKKEKADRYKAYLQMLLEMAAK